MSDFTAHILPVVILKARSPIGGLKQGLQGAGKVDKPVAHKEEHWEQRSEDVDVSEQDAALADHHREEKSPVNILEVIRVIR